MKVKSTKPFRVFEAGAGKRPLDLVKKALRARQLKRNRSFIGVDYKLNDRNLKATLKKAGVSKKPKNLKIRSGCAIKKLEKLPKSSEDVIFAGLVVRQTDLQNPTYKLGGVDARRFLRAAKSALKPNGRIVLIQHYHSKAFFEKITREMGLIPYIRDLTEIEALRSESLFLRQLATKESRKEMIMNMLSEAKSKHAIIDTLENRARDRGVTPYDLYKPILIVLRKSK
jgi:hypothetical protein